MGKLICITGKSASGKDTLFKMIKNNPFLDIEPVIPYTTRPIRTGEKDGEAYRFVSAEEMEIMERTGKILEKRTYSTTKGDWHYFTPKINLIGKKHRVMITTPAAFEKIAESTDKKSLIIVLLEAGEKKRFKRSFLRESKQTEPNYKEILRRYIADERDFMNLNLSDSFCRFIINADKSALKCYFEFLSVLRRIKKNKTDKLNNKPKYRNQTLILEKCEIMLKRIEAGEKINKNEIKSFFGL